MMMSSSNVIMRTIVDLPDPDRVQLDALCQQRGLSRAEALRQALRLWLSQQQPAHSTQHTAQCLACGVIAQKTELRSNKRCEMSGGNLNAPARHQHLIDVLRGEAIALAWLERQPSPRISMITWIEVLVGCREGEADAVRGWLESFPRLPLDDAISSETERLRQQHGLKVPDAIILATARCSQLALATSNSQDFPLSMGDVLHPYQL
jgi:predicted nucleic acid-binding protein/Arc/MetJ-type ribon-helix-helix transcriptional regulator